MGKDIIVSKAISEGAARGFDEETIRKAIMVVAKRNGISIIPEPPKCPKCKSSSVIFVSQVEPHPPDPGKVNYRCGDCGHEWDVDTWENKPKPRRCPKCGSELLSMVWLNGSETEGGTAKVTCTMCGHTWEIVLPPAKRPGCPKCGASPDKISLVKMLSPTRVLVKCNECGHEWEIELPPPPPKQCPKCGSTNITMKWTVGNPTTGGKVTYQCNDCGHTWDEDVPPPPPPQGCPKCGSTNISLVKWVSGSPDEGGVAQLSCSDCGHVWEIHLPPRKKKMVRSYDPIVDLGLFEMIARPGATDEANKQVVDNVMVTLLTDGGPIGGDDCPGCGEKMVMGTVVNRGMHVRGMWECKSCGLTVMGVS